MRSKMSIKRCTVCKRKMNYLVEVELKAGEPANRYTVCISAECNARQLILLKDKYARDTRELDGSLQFARAEAELLKREIAELRNDEAGELMRLESLVENKKRKVIAAGRAPNPFDVAADLPPVQNVGLRGFGFGGGQNSNM